MQFPHSLLLLFAATALGCGQASSYKLAKVGGVVTLDGRPLPGAVVTFQPVSRGSQVVGPGSTAHCDASGRYELTTVRAEPGAVVGKHKVTIFPAVISTSPADHPPGTDIDALVASAAGVRIPERYNYQTELAFDVPLGGVDAANFSLTTTP